VVIYLFPVSPLLSAPVRDGKGGDPSINQVSAYELHAVDFGSTADKVFGSIDRHPFVAGDFVWTGWDYLGEPTPYYLAKVPTRVSSIWQALKKNPLLSVSVALAPRLPHGSYSATLELAGTKRLDHPGACIHLGDEAELFLTGNRSEKRKRVSMNTAYAGTA
jgi:beta-galactosidase